MDSTILLKPAKARRPLSWLVAAAAALLTVQVLAAQAPTAPQPAAAQSPKQVHRRAKPSAAQTPPMPADQAPVAEAAAAPVTPPVPEVPKWPVNDQPVPASVVWDAQGLRIEAANASLQQILKDISDATGVKVDGMGTDQRVFGVFGPGQARDVLSQLFEGSGYNVLMIGDQGQGTPRQIVLTARHGGEAQPGANGAAAGGEEEAPDNDADDQNQPQQRPMPGRPNFGPGGQPRTPQQIMQEMQERQRQRQQQPQQPPPNPQN